MPSILDTIRAQNEARSAQLSEIDIVQTTNLTVKVGELNPFAGSCPIYNPDAPAGDGPTHVEGNLPCALDLRNAKAVITEVHAFQQPLGGTEAAEKARAEGKEVEMMNQVEFAVAITGGVLGFMDGEDFEPHPVYTDNQYKFVTDRALELYLKSPFRTPDDVIESLKTGLASGGFVPAELGDREGRPNKRTEVFHLQAPNNGGNNREKILARQNSGLPISEITLTAPRDVSERPTAADGTLRPEFEDFLFSFEENLYRVVVSLASGETLSKAGRLSSALTGVDGQYPLRATTASLTWLEAVPGRFESHIINFFPAQAEQAV